MDDSSALVKRSVGCLSACGVLHKHDMLRPLRFGALVVALVAKLFQGCLSALYCQLPEVRVVVAAFGSAPGSARWFGVGRACPKLAGSFRRCVAAGPNHPLTALDQAAPDARERKTEYQDTHSNHPVSMYRVSKPPWAADGKSRAGNTSGAACGVLDTSRRFTSPAGV
jgi:hypothetical protein